MSNEPQRFRLEVRVEVREIDRHGGWSTHNALSVNHTMELGTLTFLQLAGILGRFHDLGEAIKAEQDAQKSQYERDCEREGLPIVP